MSVNEDLAGAYIGHRLDLLRFEAGTVQRLTEAYEAALSGLMADIDRARSEALKGTLGPRTISALESRRDALDGELAVLLELQTALMSETLDAVARVELVTAATAWNAAVPASIGIEWQVPALVDVLAAVEDPIGSRAWPERLTNQLYELRQSIQPVLAAATVRGASMDKTAEMLSRVPALVGRKRSDLVALARTETQRVAAVAAEASYAANADVLDGVEYLATLDYRACVVCAADHGKQYPLGEAPIIPRHPRCRCFIAPVTKSWAELGLGPAQASLFDGKSSKGPDFPTWLKRQPESTADAILGKSGADAWRSGLPLEAFSDGREPLTLAEVKAANPSAFE